LSVTIRVAWSKRTIRNKLDANDVLISHQFSFLADSLFSRKQRIVCGSRGLPLPSERVRNEKDGFRLGTFRMSEAIVAQKSDFEEF
jgi:hypothetical protein